MDGKKKKEQNSESLRFPSFLSISTSSLLLVLATVCISDPVNLQIQSVDKTNCLFLFVCWALFGPIVQCDLGASPPLPNPQDYLKGSV